MDVFFDERFVTDTILHQQVDSHIERLREVLNAPSYPSKISSLILGIIGRHNYVTKQYAKPEWLGLAAGHESLAPVSEGKIACIDGREPHAIQDGGKVERWSVPGGLINLTKIGSEVTVESGKLVAEISALAQKDREVVELMKIHTSSSSPISHGCAALAIAFRSTTKLEPQDNDLIEFGLKALKEREKPLLTVYNRARKQHGHKTLKKITFLGISDTDSMALILQGNDEEKPLSTAVLADNLFADLSKQLKKAYGERYEKVGFLQDTFTDPETIIDFETVNYNLTRFLMRYEPFIRQINRYIDSSNLSAFSENQKIGVMHIVARNLANIYAIDLKSQKDHPFKYHREKYASVAVDGIHVGQRDPQVQVLKANPGNPQAAIPQVHTQLKVLRGNNPNKPYILFIASVATTPTEAERIQAQAVNYELYMQLMQDEDIKNAIAVGELIPVPVILDEKRLVQEIPLY